MKPVVLILVASVTAAALPVARAQRPAQPADIRRYDLLIWPDECGGIRVLTDPVFGDYASPVSFAGRKRFHPVPAPLARLPPLDIVLLSHDHYDHLCRSTMRELASMRVPIVTSLGVGERLEKLGIIAVGFYPKGKTKSSVAVQHTKLPDKKTATKSVS